MKNSEELVTITLIDNRITHSRRQRREADTFPPILQFNLTSNTKHIELFLRRNSLKAAVPYYTQVYDEIVKHTPANEKKIKFYTDVEQTAAIGIHCAESGHNTECNYVLNGNLVINGEFHVIRRRSVDIFSPHVLVQTEETYNFGTDYRDIPEEINIGLTRKSDSLVSGRSAGGGNPDTVTHYKVELLPVVDFAVYEYWYNLQDPGKTEAEKYAGAVDSLTEYYAYVINTMNVHYESIRGVPWDIEIIYAGIYVADVPAASNWTESLKVTRTGDRLWIEAKQALDRFKAWLEVVTGLPDYDHAMAFTGYEMYRVDSSNNELPGVLGLAWIASLCRKQNNQFYENSVIEDHSEAIIGHVAAHELGHNLGALHDGQNNDCSSSKRYVMAPSIGVRTSEKGINRFIFSNCSVDYFQTYIDDMDTNGYNCMTSLRASHDPTALDQYSKTFNGHIYQPDEQCQHYRNGSSYLCRHLHYADPTTVCKYIYCSIPDNPSICSIHFPWDGTVCGDGQWCVAGKCCNDTRAKSADPNCVFGDAPFCSAKLLPSPSICYQNYYNTAYCCSICQNFLTRITGCEYGDRANGCVAADCPIYTATKRDVTCCKTCALQPETTTMQTTTTELTTTTTEPTTTTTEATTTETTSIASTATRAITTVTNATTTNDTAENTNAADTTTDDDILLTIVIPIVVTIMLWQGQ